MSFTATIEGPQQGPVDSKVDFTPAETWTTQDMIMAAQQMRSLAPGDDDWAWGYQRDTGGVVITVKIANGTTIRSAPLDVPEVVVPRDEPPHWFGRD